MVFFLSVLIIYVAFFSIWLQVKHFLCVLLLFEVITLGMFSMMFFVFSMNSDLFLILLFVAIMVCDAACGLSLLVCSARKFGNDSIYGLILNKF
uniref:NADH dehydrogenase subunit 4L n=1 Tax=Tropidomya abbreviata TaxID=102404 RepID=A0A1U9XPK1_9BIVA|nr:NADH dehydrogenase subunit 4L [Tropidomya abbreviata]AQZ26181.1 NADH dehydrogenase subunit 4L [Tropidomya abbreviata]